MRPRRSRLTRNPLAPAQYAAHHRAPRCLGSTTPATSPPFRELCQKHNVGAVVPLTDLDLEVLAHARAAGELPAFVPDAEIARATFDKYEAHLLLESLGLPSPPTVLPGEPVSHFPVMVKPRQGSGARSIHRADDARAAEFFVDYVEEPTMVQWWMRRGPGVLDRHALEPGRPSCLNAIPRTMIESRGGESIKGTVIDDPELVQLGRRVVEAIGARGPCTVQAFRDREIGLGITDVNTRFGGAFPAPMYAALPGRTYPELIVRMARGETIEPHVGEYTAGVTFTRFYSAARAGRAIRPDRPRHRQPAGSAASPVATGRVGSALHCDQEPAYSRPGRMPACSSTSRLWQAVTPEPHEEMTGVASSIPSPSNLARSSCTETSRPSRSRFSRHGNDSAPGMCPPRGSRGSKAPLYRSRSRASSRTSVVPATSSIDASSAPGQSRAVNSAAGLVVEPVSSGPLQLPIPPSSTAAS